MPADKLGPAAPLKNHLADNLRRIMVREGWSIADIVERTGLDTRTIRSLLGGGDVRPHSRTLHQLTRGLGIDADELFQNPSLLARRMFDRRTNPVVDVVVREEPHLFDGWTLDDFDDLYSRFGTGGEMTLDGARAAVDVINLRRTTLGKVALLLETGQAELLVKMIDVLYEQVVVVEPDDCATAGSSSSVFARV